MAETGLPSFVSSFLVGDSTQSQPFECTAAFALRRRPSTADDARPPDSYSPTPGKDASRAGFVVTPPRTVELAVDRPGLACIATKLIGKSLNALLEPL
jgi:hypothetical protein